MFSSTRQRVEAWVRGLVGGVVAGQLADLEDRLVDALRAQAEAQAQAARASEQRLTAVIDAAHKALATDVARAWPLITGALHDEGRRHGATIGGLGDRIMQAMEESEQRSRAQVDMDAAAVQALAQELLQRADAFRAGLEERLTALDARFQEIEFKFRRATAEALGEQAAERILAFNGQPRVLTPERRQ